MLCSERVITDYSCRQCRFLNSTSKIMITSQNKLVPPYHSSSAELVYGLNCKLCDSELMLLPTTYHSAIRWATYYRSLVTSLVIPIVDNMELLELCISKYFNFLIFEFTHVMLKVFVNLGMVVSSSLTRSVGFPTGLAALPTTPRA